MRTMRVYRGMGRWGTEVTKVGGGDDAKWDPGDGMKGRGDWDEAIDASVQR